MVRIGDIEVYLGEPAYDSIYVELPAGEFRDQGLIYESSYEGWRVVW